MEIVTNTLIMNNKERILSEILFTEQGENVTSEEMTNDYEFYNRLMQRNLTVEIDEINYETGYLHGNLN